MRRERVRVLRRISIVPDPSPRREAPYRQPIERCKVPISVSQLDCELW